MQASTTARPRAAAGAEDTSRFLSRWLKVWVALLAVVTLVVVVYLIFITNSLASINKNLGVAQRSVSGAGGHTKTLPDQVQGINASLAAIDPALKPIPGQADQIISALTDIDGKLKVTDGSLMDTSSSLQSTSSQLTDTSGVLQTVLGQANTIKGTLAAADRPAGDCGAGPGTGPVVTPPGPSCNPSQLGVQNIHQRVGIANGILTPVITDANNILGGLNSANPHLRNICNNSTVKLVASLSGTPASC